MPYIVRMETGTINRAIYQTTMLHDPHQRAGAELGRAANWNRRLIYTFGGGCIGGWYRQGATTGGVTDDFMLRKGYALASSSLNVFGNNCNDLTAAEIDDDGEGALHRGLRPAGAHAGLGLLGRLVRAAPDHRQLSRSARRHHPGLLVPGGRLRARSTSSPTPGCSTITSSTPAAGRCSDEQKRHVTGFLVYNTAAQRRGRRAPHRPDAICGTAACRGLRYNPATNPTGARCDVYDHTVNVYGRDPATGFARRPLDNVGIQYGLKALNDGVITVDQFLDLNERSAASTSTPTSVPSAPWPTRARRARPTRPDA